jgi:BCD family chlorophyll transporter-like MFS transporter
LIQVVQGAAALTMLLNMVALWKQEARNPSRTTATARAARPAFRESWRQFVAGGRASRLLVSVALGSAAFSMQDILLEPYGGQIMGLSVGATSALTALLAGGALAAFALASRWLLQGGDPCRIAGCGVLVGVVAFAAVLFAHPIDSPLLFRAGAVLIGFGGGLFSVGTLTAAMGLDIQQQHGLALGAWGAVQASATGIAIGAGGALRDVFSGLALHGALGPALTGPAVGYSLVYQIEIVLLFATLVAIGPLVRAADPSRGPSSVKLGLAEMPG